MFCIDNADKAKKSARSLEKFLKKAGIDLKHGQALNAIAALAGHSDWNAMRKSLNTEPSVAQAPSILDIDYDRVSQIRLYGSSYNVYPNTYILRMLRDGERGVDWDDDDEVLDLESLNEDAYESTVLTATELLDFKWNPQKQCFVNSKEQEFQALEVRPYAFVQAVPNVEMATDGETNNTLITRFKVYVYCDESFVGTHECVASSKAEAHEAALDSLWDERVERCEARLFSEQMEDDEGGYFSVLIDEEKSVEEELFSVAYQKARELAAGNPHSVVTVQNADETSIVTFNR